MARQRTTLIEAVVFLSLASILLVTLGGGCVAMTGARFWKYSDGFRDGTVYKLSRKGYLVKTYEGELATEGYSREAEVKSGQSGGNRWAFSVEDPLVWQELQSLPPNEHVRLHYTEWAANGWNGTNYLVHKVEKFE